MRALYPKTVGLFILAIVGVGGAIAFGGIQRNVLSGKATNTPGTANFEYPEKREYLKEAGASDAPRFAKYLKPNVGVSEEEMGISYERFRRLEAQIKSAVTAENPSAVANRLKKEKYGVTTGKAAPDMPKGIKWSDWEKTQEYKAGDVEWNNTKKVPPSINADMADYVLKITDGVLSSNGIKPKGVLRAKAFVLGSYAIEKDIPYKSPESAFGPGQGVWGPTVNKGVFCLDEARGLCRGKAATFVYMVNAKSKELGVQADVTSVYRKCPPGDPMFKEPTNHGNAVVTYSNGKVEGYDPTLGCKIDCRNPNLAALWVAQFRGYRASPPYGTYTNDYKRMKEGDPISSISEKDFKDISWSEVSAIKNATRTLRW